MNDWLFWGPWIAIIVLAILLLPGAAEEARAERRYQAEKEARLDRQDRAIRKYLEEDS